MDVCGHVPRVVWALGKGRSGSKGSEGGGLQHVELKFVERSGLTINFRGTAVVRVLKVSTDSGDV